MNKKIIAIAIIVIVIAVGAYLLFNKPNSGPQTQNNQPAGNEQPASKLNPGDAQYFVETQLVSLKDGKAETIAPYGAAKQTTEIAGNPIAGDMNSDGQPDWAVILTQKTENDPGVYYYAAVALVDEAKALIVGSNAVPLGDRIDVKNMAIVNDAVKIDYLDWRTNGDAVESSPSMPVSKSFILDGVMFKELTDKRASAQFEAACTDNRGEWNKDSNECTGISQELCAKFGGKSEGNSCKF